MPLWDAARMEGGLLSLLCMGTSVKLNHHKSAHLGWGGVEVASLPCRSARRRHRLPFVVAVHSDLVQMHAELA